MRGVGSGELSTVFFGLSIFSRVNAISPTKADFQKHLLFLFQMGHQSGGYLSLREMVDGSLALALCVV